MSLLTFLLPLYWFVERIRDQFLSFTLFNRIWFRLVNESIICIIGRQKISKWRVLPSNLNLLIVLYLYHCSWVSEGFLLWCVLRKSSTSMWFHSDWCPSLDLLLWRIWNFWITDVATKSITTWSSFSMLVTKWQRSGWRTLMTIWQCCSSRCILAIIWNQMLLCMAWIQVNIFSWKWRAYVRLTFTNLLCSWSYCSWSIQFYCLLGTLYKQLVSKCASYTYCWCLSWQFWIWTLGLTFPHNLQFWH